MLRAVFCLSELKQAVISDTSNDQARLCEINKDNWTIKVQEEHVTALKMKLHLSN